MIITREGSFFYIKELRIYSNVQKNFIDWLIGGEQVLILEALIHEE